MTDALIVIGCFVAGYFVAWLRATLRHGAACDRLGAHLLYLADYPPDPATLRRLVAATGRGLLGDKS